jgi:hypothetical protein
VTDHGLDEYGFPLGDSAFTAAESGEIVLRSEFSIIEVKLDESANGARLRIYAPETGAVMYLDPLELEGITRMTHEQLVRSIPPPSADLGRI